MKNKFITPSNGVLVLLSLLFVFVLGSCKDDDDDPTPQPIANPGTVGVVVEGTEVQIDWAPSPSASNTTIEYEVEVATDENFSNVVHSTVTTDTNVVLTEEQLDEDETYYVRVKATSQDDSPDSDWVTGPSFSIVGGGDEGLELIDLSEVTDPDTLMAAFPYLADGGEIVLARGETYNISSTTSLNKSFTIRSADGEGEPATIYFTSNFTIDENSDIGSIEFRDLIMYSDNYDSRYVFNINNPGNIGTLTFESVNARLFRGLVRLQTGGDGTHIETLTINDSQLDSLREYAVIHMNNSNSANNVSITNSTITNAQRIILSSTAANSVTIENVTVNRAPGGGNFVIDYSATNVVNTITISNTIFGSTVARYDDPDRTQGNGLRVAEGSAINVTDTYVTTDFDVNNPIPDVIPYSGASTDLWTDPINNDFTFEDNDFVGKENTGDPRWR